MRKLILPVLTFLGTAVVANTITPPAKLRFNKTLFQRMINTGDQNIMKSFENLPLGTFTEGELSIENVLMSLAQAEGELADFDFDTTFTNELISTHSSNLLFRGQGKVGEEEVHFEAPLDRMAFQFVAADDEFKHEDIVLEIQADKIKVEPEQSANNPAVQAWIKEQLALGVHNVEKKALSGDFETLMTAPLSLIIPLGFTYVAALGAKKVEVSEKFIDYGFNPESF